MNSLNLPASTRMLVKMMLASLITLAAFAFLSVPVNGQAKPVASKAAHSTGSVVIRMSAFQPDKLDQDEFNDL